MDDQINQFLNMVCSHIKYEQVHQEIRDELTVHIHELKDAYMSETQDEKIALDMAISSMGDCDEIGRCLNKQHKPETEWSLLILTAMISFIGIALIYANCSLEANNSLTPISNFKNHLISVALGIAVMAVFYFIDYTKLKKYMGFFYLLSITLNVICIVYTIKYNGRLGTLYIGNVRLSPYFIVILFMISMVGFLDWAYGKGLIGIIKISLLIPMPIFLISSFGLSFTIVIVFVGMVLFVIAFIRNHFTCSKKQQIIIWGVIASLCLIVFFFIGSSFQNSFKWKDRINAFLTEGQSDPNGAGYQIIMADKWLKSAEIFGTTSARINGNDASTTLPELTTNYALINVFITLGSMVGIAFIIITIIFIIRMFIVVLKIQTSYGFYLSLASCTMLAVQFITGILMNLNIIPNASIYLPFISYGSSEYICSMALVGLILSVWRRNNLISAASVLHLELNHQSKQAVPFIQYEDGKLMIDLKRIYKSCK